MQLMVAMVTGHWTAHVMQHVEKVSNDGHGSATALRQNMADETRWLFQNTFDHHFCISKYTKFLQYQVDAG